MRSAERVHGICRRLGATALCVLLAPPALLAGESAERAPSPAATSTPPEPKTLKEKLSDKASDEQRVDNCGVPLERRGARSRPDCAPKLSGPAAK